MVEAGGMRVVVDRATRHQPDTRIVTTGDAVNARALNGLGGVNEQCSVVPRFFQDQLPLRFLGPWRIDAHHLPDEALGRALDTLSADDVPARSRLIAATAAERRGPARRVAPLDRPSVHVDGHETSGKGPADQVVPSTRGDSQDHRPDLTPVRLEWLIEYQARMPVRMNPLSR
jgi:hypothetical protein